MRKYAPNADPTRSDIWTSVANMIPNVRGNYMTANVGVTITGAGPATPGTTLRAWVGLLPSGATQAYTGTTTKLYATDYTTFTDRSKGGGYSNTATDWNFTQFGNFTIATNNVDPIQVRDATGVAAFADLAGTPPTTAKIVLTQSNAVLAFNTNSGGQYWAASDVLNQANWTTGKPQTPRSTIAPVRLPLPLPTRMW
jgi:hypothetical protein